MTANLAANVKLVSRSTANVKLAARSAHEKPQARQGLFVAYYRQSYR
jgi:hypothetical protein